MAIEVQILDASGQVKGTKPLSEKFEAEKGFSVHLLHEVVRSIEQNRRAGTHETKTRSHVSFSNKKPWKQKHTGSARSGRRSSPLWRGGGITHGAHPRSYRSDLPQSKRQKALVQAILARVQSGDLFVSDALVLDQAKTKFVDAWLKSRNLPNETLYVTVSSDPKLLLASRNIKGFRWMLVKDLNAREILASRKIVFSQEAVEQL